MSPKQYERHRERTLYLSDHPLTDYDRADIEERDTRQATLDEVSV